MTRAFARSFRRIGDTANGGLSVETLLGELAVLGFTVRPVESLTQTMFNLLRGRPAHRDRTARRHLHRRQLGAVVVEDLATVGANSTRFGRVVVSKP